MLQLADDVFASKTDINQLDINEHVLEHLQKIHPATVSEFDDGSGPVAWLLLIPTSRGLMNQFLECKISERELYELTPLNVTYDTLYLCSAMVLEEYRRRGITKQLAHKAIESIRKNHPIQALFVWTFSPEGLIASKSLAQQLNLPLYQRRDL